LGDSTCYYHQLCPAWLLQDWIMAGKVCVPSSVVIALVSWLLWNSSAFAALYISILDAFKAKI